MKKLGFILLSVVIAVSCMVGFDAVISNRLNELSSKAIYHNSDNRNNCERVMQKIIDDDFVVVLGSSELGAADEIAYPPALFNNGNADFNMIMIGRGYTQSLSHAIDVGALQKKGKNNKVVLILSPQWFTKGHITSEIFCGRFLEAPFVEFLKNNSVSVETKTKVYNRVYELLEDDPTEQKRVEKYADIYLYNSKNPILYIEMYTWDLFRDAKIRFALYRELKESSAIGSSEKVKAEDIDFEELLQKAEAQGKKECTNNDFGIYDEYYDTYVREVLDERRGSETESSYTDSKEYDDLRLFLDVCKETGVKPMIVSVPVNGRWYDYTGFPKDDRQQYYQNITEICNEYDVELADFSDREYELYFLKDIMHMGWKGWVNFDKAVFDYCKE